MIYVICGPTGSGKTSTAIKIANFLNAPIINADGFQIYKDMNIGTAKISQMDPNYKKHYLLDIVSPEETFSVKEYQILFRRTLEELQKNYKDIVVCGGTGLYIRASLYDYIFDDEIKDDTSDLEVMSNEELFILLQKLDVKSSETIHQNNRKRVIRAISIARTHNILKSDNIEKQAHKIIYDDVRIMMINPDREKVYCDINKRVDDMFNDGLVEEVKTLLNKYSLSHTSKQAIGYKETIEYLEGLHSFEECKELIKQRTRNYAKRQVTFFKHQFDIEEYSSPNDLLSEVGING